MDIRRPYLDELSASVARTPKSFGRSDVLSSPSKRALDIVLASVTLVAVLPLGLAIAALIKLTSRGPVFFVHERVGCGGLPFRLVKFRSMQHGTHQQVQTCPDQRQAYQANDFKLPANDPRIHRFGRLLRASSLDELPQLLNVLKGDMSLVGVRPVPAEELELRTPNDQHCYARMRPGMTGLWQVTGRSTVGAADRVALDREYVEQWTLWNDVKILARTPLAILRFHHAA